MACIIWFKHPRAIRHLLEYGEVYTLRARRKPCPKEHVIIRLPNGARLNGTIEFIRVVNISNPGQLA